MATPIRRIELPFAEKFDDVIEESSNPDNSTHPWLNVSSGGFYNISKGSLRTSGALPIGHRWQKAYATNIDCEGGTRPENIARIRTRQDDFLNVTVTATVKINRVSLTDSPNRTPDKGISIFLHYKTENDLYVAGVRHGGEAFVKRKAAGVYSTLGIVPWYSGTWDKMNHPTLLPVGTFFSIKAQIQYVYGKTNITLWVSEPGTTTFQTALNIVDDFPALAGPGRIGLRSDFASIEITELFIT